jgi:hypothetical protein
VSIVVGDKKIIDLRKVLTYGEETEGPVIALRLPKYEKSENLAEPFEEGKTVIAVPISVFGGKVKESEIHTVEIGGKEVSVREFLDNSYAYRELGDCIIEEERPPKRGDDQSQ